MSAIVQLPNTSTAQLDEAVARLRAGAASWAQAAVSTRIKLAQDLQSATARAAERMVAAACAAKGLALDEPAAGEEWLGGPYVVLTILGQIIESLESIARTGSTPEGRLGKAFDGRLVEQLFPSGPLERMVFAGISGEVHYQEGIDARAMRAARARFYRAPHHQGRVCLVLGAGNVNSIPIADLLYKMFNEGTVCVLKCNPVNAYMGTFVEEIFQEAIERHWLQVVHGGAAEGAHLAAHPGVDEVHVTGSDRTHDAIVWGPPGPERSARMAADRPALDKEITSELGNVTPVLVVPGPWSARELARQADNVAGMVTNNASFNCIAGKMLLLPARWGDRERFLDLLMAAMGRTRARRAWYPGARDRYRALVDGRAGLRTAGADDGEHIPWTLLPGLDATEPREPAFRTEPFCALISETPIAADGPEAFLEAAVRFANERLWGTLAAAILIHPRTERALGGALARAVRQLRYGTVCVNVWPGLAYATGTLPWGAYPGAPLHDIQSGRGFVHDTRMVGLVEKSVVRAPAAPLAKLPYVPSHRTAHLLGRRLTSLRVRGWRALPGVVAAALRG